MDVPEIVTPGQASAPSPEWAQELVTLRSHLARQAREMRSLEQVLAALMLRKGWTSIHLDAQEIRDAARVTLRPQIDGQGGLRLTLTREVGKP